MKMTQEQYDNYLEEDAGFCLKCDVVCMNSCCDACGNTKIITLEEAHELEDIEISEDEDEDDSYVSSNDDDY